MRRGGRRGPIGVGQGRGGLGAGGSGGRCGRAWAAAAEWSGAEHRVGSDRIRPGAAMSLSNKLTLDKVDVKGKRVVMR